MINNIKKKIIAITLLTTMLCYTIPTFAFTKNETIYSKTDNIGNIYKTIVSTHIDNKENLNIINDITNLLNIENTNGDEAFSKNGDTLIWDAKGRDIYYQGETQEKLPISMEIKYELDGSEVSAEEITGKSGKVKIKIEYKNTEEHIVNINGRNEKIYTPFIIIGGTIIENSKNTNISVKNAKIINDGTKNIVIGVAMPGLQESLNISVDIPSGFEITMDAIDFELDGIITFATPKLLDEENSKIIDEIKEITSKINLIGEATNSLKDGAETLKNGTNEYSKKSELFNDKMSDLSTGVSYINSQYKNIDYGINTLNAGVTEIYNGVQELPVLLDTLVSGLDDANVALMTIKTAQSQVIFNNAEIVAITNAITTDSTLDVATKQALITKLQVANGTLQQTNTGIGALADSIDIQKEVLVENSRDITNLVGGITKIYNGLNDKEKGLVVGSSKVKMGLDTLASSTVQLKQANDSLTEGARTITNGATELSNGVTTFSNEIRKYTNGDMSRVISRAEVLVKLSEEYNNFTKINEQANGKVKFIIMTDALKKKEEKSER